MRIRHQSLHRVYILTAAFSLMQTYATAFADTLKEEISASLDAIKQKQDLSSREGKRIQANAERMVESLVKSADDEAPIESDPSRSIISHVIVETDVVFPPPEKVVLPNQKVELSPPVPPPTELDESADGVVDSPKVPRCDVNRTERVQRISGNAGSDLILDHVFLPTAMVPSEPDEVYGTTARLYVYNGPADLPTRRAARNQAVPCFPFRIRLTGQYEYRDYGTAAYRNFGKDQKNPGKIHDWVKAKLAEGIQ